MSCKYFLRRNPILTRFNVTVSRSVEDSQSNSSSPSYPIHPPYAPAPSQVRFKHYVNFSACVPFCIHLKLQCTSHYRCATTCPQQREDGEITPPFLRSLTARPPTLHAGTLVLFFCLCVRQYRSFHAAYNYIKCPLFLCVQDTSSVAPSIVAMHQIHSPHPSPWTLA